MGKSEGFLTPKAIANRIKAKGLTKLRWYCQVCEKPCRDDNGFKCHIESESHLRKIALVQEKPGKFIDQYSQEFERDMCDLLSRRWRGQRVKATYAYNEFISDRHHTHMNATRWHTLTEFVKYLGRCGKANVEQEEDGAWFITWIDRDPVILARQAAADKRSKVELDEREREERQIQRQYEELKKKEQERQQSEKPEPAEFQRDPDTKIQFRLGPATRVNPLMQQSASASVSASASASASSASSASASIAKKENPDDSAPSVFEAPSKPTSSEAKRPAAAESQDSSKRPRLSAVEEIILQEQARKQKIASSSSSASAAAASSSKSSRVKFWIRPHIVVKIINKKLCNGEFYKKKGVIEEVIDEHIAHVRVLDTDDVIKIDQVELETVVPNIGGRVLVLNGPHRGYEAKLESINVDKFCATLLLLAGPNEGQTINADYEDFSKLQRN